MKSGIRGLGACALVWAAAAGADEGRLLGQPAIEAALGGETGARLAAIAENWLLPAPDANPAMLEMLRLRDRQPPYENPVPWAGEFAGKYLTAGVAVSRLVDHPALDARLAAFVDELIATQAEDGYMGPFPRDRRLLGEWDLWGHYHVTLGLLAWHRDRGDDRAFETATRMADLMCRTYLDGERRVHDAGWQEMNMAVIDSLGMLHRATGEPRYLELMRAIEADWQKPPAGDYLRQALAGAPFYRTPKPRWESLHVMEGLAEMYRITGDANYKKAHLHYWHSINELDVHNAGSFSTNEGAVGNPFTEGAIETCCTVAWIAYSIDALRLSGDSRIADAIELSTWNAVLGYQHPSGRWCTYDTPMDGKRLASAHSIIFQSRPGTPELNCCSVNGPRGLGMISEWAVLGDGAGLYLNYFGPGTFRATLDDGSEWTFVQETDYPRDGVVRIRVTAPRDARTPLFVRIPAWADGATLTVEGEEVAAEPGAYARIDREWKRNDTIVLTLPMTVRALRADAHRQFRTSLYRGPLLLAYDQKFNAFDPAAIPELDLAGLELRPAEAESTFRPIVLFDAVSADGASVRLCDYASAGAHGTYYQSWLPVRNAPPAAFRLQRPQGEAAVPANDGYFLWTAAAPDARYTLTLRTADGAIAAQRGGFDEAHALVDLSGAAAPGSYLWSVTATIDGVDYPQADPPRAITILPPRTEAPAPLVRDELDGALRPIASAVLVNEGIAAAPNRDGTANGAVRIEGEASKAVYGAPGLRTDAYSAALWFHPDDMSGRGPHHLLSCWAVSMDDPLRISITGMELWAGIETAGGGARTPGIRIKPGRWRHVAAVKEGTELRLYLDGALRHTVQVPAVWDTRAEAIGLGCNPNFGEREGFRGALDEFVFEQRAWSDAEVLRMAGRDRP